MAFRQTKNMGKVIDLSLYLSDENPHQMCTTDFADTGQPFSAIFLSKLDTVKWRTIYETNYRNEKTYFL